ncbi:carbohydrate ABC transporter substrate-binding protein [Plantactinospora sp. S1510]|uniref:Carbohydrate ABC transporter substrate-binding protein n=1 Tax=Plantactinospora alkalitolerans TaxID=2789879 RepID=A0ABS0H477_9ACTN|nr:ABC transporter substrate-binding protein [Plantactinospora alkalitolerans]MBF9133267.1 carbohydrate ABC transporter substrate-binding protein [Plantactinospora alkalitolerans]
MAVKSRPRQALVIASVLTLALGATACSGDSDSGLDPDSPECAPYTNYQGHDGESVSIYASIRDKEADLLRESWKQFEECTGIEIDYDGSGEFEAQLQVKVDGGNPPDLAFIPQPGLLARFAEANKLKPMTPELKTIADGNYPADWLKYATAGGQLYGTPLGANVKSFVWYSPKTFAEKGYQVPTTWQDLMALSDKIVATKQKPWCVGLESGEATGWPATDWIEDLMLRTQTPEVYDQWTTHAIPFNDPRVAQAVDQVGSVLKNPKYVNGGYGDVKSLTTTPFQEGGLPILQGQCSLHRQANFYANYLPEGTKVGPDGDIYAFYFPAVDPSKGKPVLGGGEFTVAFTDTEATQAVRTYLASGEYANSRAKLGNWITPNNKLDVSNVQQEVDKLAMQVLLDKSAVFRFDGSDLMPAAVGSGTLWKGMIDWVNGKDTKSTLDFIEGSWPK